MIVRCQAPTGDRGRVCGRRLGESAIALIVAGTARDWEDRLGVTDRVRDVRLCPKCRWYTVFLPANGVAAS